MTLNDAHTKSFLFAQEIKAIQKTSDVETNFGDEWAQTNDMSRVFVSHNAYESLAQ
jgi:hypothetical protein